MSVWAGTMLFCKVGPHCCPVFYSPWSHHCLQSMLVKWVLCLQCYVTFWGVYYSIYDIQLCPRPLASAIPEVLRSLKHRICSGPGFRRSRSDVPHGIWIPGLWVWCFVSCIFSCDLHGFALHSGESCMDCLLFPGCPKNNLPTQCGHRNAKTKSMFCMMCLHWLAPKDVHRDNHNTTILYTVNRLVFFSN